MKTKAKVEKRRAELEARIRKLTPAANLGARDDVVQYNHVKAQLRQIDWVLSK